MPTHAGPNSRVDSSLVFCSDTYDGRNGVSPLGCGGFNGSTQYVKDLVTNSTALLENSVRVDGRQYFTIFAIDYPESSYGGSAASRDGITPGFNVTSGTITGPFGRSFNYYVWNEDTQDWIADSYFNGLRENGHCYDLYDVNVDDTEWAQFLEDYGAITGSFPNATHILAGSHRDRYHPADKLTLLKDLGAPSNIDSLLDSAPEYILIGKPGLGEGNGYGWSFENYTTDPTRVAHLNVGLPIFKGGPLILDGTDDVVTFLAEDTTDCDFTTGDFSIEFVAKQDPTVTRSNARILARGAFNTVGWEVFLDTNNTALRLYDGNTNEFSYFTTTSTRNHYLYTRQGSIVTLYLNGIQVKQSTLDVTVVSSSNNLVIGGRSNASDYRYGGDVSMVKIYNKALNSQEALQNYNLVKNRYGS